MRTTLATAVLLIGAVLDGLPSVAGAQEQKTDSPLTPAELARRMQQRRAVEAVIWGMPAVNYDLMRQEMLDKTDEPPCSFTVDEERRVIVDYAAADNAVFLVAEVDGEIVGELDCRGGMRSSMRHAALLGVSVRAGWRDRGVGSALLAAALDWARATGVVTRIELSVYAENARAIHLYEKFGFAIEGRRRDAVRHSGRLVDDLVMARLL